MAQTVVEVVQSSGRLLSSHLPLREQWDTHTHSHLLITDPNGGSTLLKQPCCRHCGKTAAREDVAAVPSKGRAH